MPRGPDWNTMTQQTESDAAQAGCEMDEADAIFLLKSKD